MSERSLGGGGGADGRGHAGNNLERNVVAAERFDLFPGASENQRIATLQPHYAQSRSRQCDHQTVDFPLQDFLFPSSLANVVNLGALRNQLQDLVRYNLVVQKRLGA